MGVLVFLSQDFADHQADLRPRFNHRPQKDQLIRIQSQFQKGTQRFQTVPSGFQALDFPKDSSKRTTKVVEVQ